jgi:O-antigen ligase
MDRLSRIVALCSLLAAIALQARLGARDYGPLIVMVEGAIAAGLIGGLAAPRVAAPIVLAFTYIAPVALTLAIGRYRPPFILIWIGAVAGLTMSSGVLRGWALPPRWRWPLIAVALVVAIGWPIVVWRETDFNLALLDNYRVANTSGGVAPPVAAVGILETAIAHLIGLLWFDFLYARYREEAPARFLRVVAAPLALSAALGCALGAYQAFVDLTFWSSGRWAAIRRASGALLDANLSGMAAACWMPAFVALAWSSKPRWRIPIASAAVLLSFAAVWSSGSRTALLAALVGIGFTLVAAARQTTVAIRRRSAVAIGATAVAALVLFSVLPLPTVGPLERLRAGIQHASSQGRAGVLTTLWDRDTYGSASTRAIRETPWVGVGVGAFTLMSMDFVRANGGPEVPFDNAQNWLRHQIAELGVIGSAGWFLWIGLFAVTLLRARASPGTAVPAGSIKGALLGLAAASMLGVPSVSPSITLTFWTFAFWFLRLIVQPEGEESRTPRLLARPAAAWAAVGAVVFTYTIGTIYVGRHAFSVPARAQRFGWNYNYGFYDPEIGEGKVFRWARQSAVIVVPVEGRAFNLRVWTQDPAVTRRPVKARVWIDNELVIDETLTSSKPIARRIPLRADEKRMMLRTWVDRTWSPGVQGSHDARELGLAVGDWTFEN